MREVAIDKAVEPFATVYAALQEQWRRHLCSGMLLERGIKRQMDHLRPYVLAQTAACEAKLATAVLHACALEGCGAREVHKAQFKLCARCQAAKYCCKEHQQADWPAHKAACKAACKAAAEGGAGPSGSA
jgi:hypothetical protein